MKNIYEVFEMAYTSLFNILKERARRAYGFDTEINGYQMQVANKQNEINSITRAKAKLIQEYNLLQSNYDFKNPTNVPEKDVSYSRPMILNNKTIENTRLDVRSFVMKDYYIYNDLKKNDLLYTGKQDLNELIPQINTLAHKKYKYSYDSSKGFAEYWLFPFETREFIKKDIGCDCEDWAIYTASYMLNANIPYSKYLVSAGYTRSGFGHATNYYNDGETWRHINSTTRNKTPKDLTEYPDKDDNNDKIGIENNKYWFSFNNTISINAFETNGQKELMKQKYPEVIIK